MARKKHPDPSNTYKTSRINIIWRRSINEQDIHDPTSGDLHIDPFSSRPDPAYYYSFTSFEQRLHILQRLVQGQDFLILVIGKAGSGKTVLLNRFFESTEKNWRTCRIRTRLTTPSAHRPSLDNLNHHPAYILQENQIPIVMIDDAHHLSETELKYLLQDALMPGSRQKLKRLVLLCEPQILTIMEDISKAISTETAINKIFMPSITRAETAAYLWHRLSTAGFRGKNPFTSETVKKINRASGGLPGRINEEAHKHLQGTNPLNKSIFSLFRIKGFNPKRFWLWVGGGLIAVALAFWVTRPDPIIGPLVRTEQPDTPSSAGVVKKKIKRAAPPSIRVNRPAKSKQAKKSRSKTIPSMLIKPKSRPQAALKPKESPPEVAIIYKDSAEIQPERQTVSKRIYREKWLLRQKPSFYTIQIMGGRNEKALRNYVQTNRHRYRGPMAYYQTKYKGGTWYPLLYGLYPTRKQALAAQRALPEDIQRLSPWIRKLSAVQKAVKEGNKGR
jgi:DamX protein